MIKIKMAHDSMSGENKMIAANGKDFYEVLDEMGLGVKELSVSTKAGGTAVVKLTCLIMDDEGVEITMDERHTQVWTAFTTRGKAHEVQGE